MHGHRHPAGMAITDLDVAIDHHVLANKAHRTHADGIAQFLELILHLRNPGIAVAAAHNPQRGGAFAKGHADVLGPAQPDPDDRRLAGETRLPKAIRLSR